ncbi:MAG: hypothetical protein K0S47_4008 [Herbinix sp.]|jgi:hypothetical protein|nr:hypothetical protein [Herbinix sp.]
MKKHLAFSLILGVMIFCTGCGQRVSTNNPVGEESTHYMDTGLSSIAKNSLNSQKKLIEDPVLAINNQPGESLLKKDIPLPLSEYSIDWESGVLFKNIRYENTTGYFETLQNEGWKIYDGTDTIEEDINSIDGEQLAELPEGTNEYLFVKNDQLLQLILYLTNKKDVPANSIFLRLEEGITKEDLFAREDAMTTKKAHSVLDPQIKELVDDGTIMPTKAFQAGLVEIFIPDAYDKMKLQAYEVVSEEGIAGYFLVCNNSAMFLYSDLNNTCVADIDEDGEYELLDLFGWGSGIYRIEMSAYSFSNPIYFSSLTKIIHRKYYNCLVPKNGYAELEFVKIDDHTVKLKADGTVYGTIKTDGLKLTLESMEDFPFDEWGQWYDQDILTTMDKEYPKEPPEIIMSIRGRRMDYITQKISWDGKDNSEYHSMKVLEQTDSFLPTYVLNSIVYDEISPEVVLDFGNHIPDTIQVYDAILDENGGFMYGKDMELLRDIKILDRSKVSFDLVQHMALLFSSNLETYQKVWRRLFRVVCTWGDNQCEYSMVINTGLKEDITKIKDHDFISCEGEYSLLSSDWGIGITVDPIKELPEQFIIEWQTSGGQLLKWSEDDLTPEYITKENNRFLTTSSEDLERVEVIWRPDFSEEAEDTIITAYVYENEEERSPVAYGQLVIENKDGVFKEKKD